MTAHSAAPVVLEAPHADKQHMYSFWGRTKVQTMAMNTAIGQVLKEHGLSPFHQVGVKSEGEHEPGYHAWEIWRPATEEKLTEMLEHIEETAMEELTMVRSMYTEKDFPEMYEPADFGDRVEAMIDEHKEKARHQSQSQGELSQDPSNDLAR